MHQKGTLRFFKRICDISASAIAVELMRSIFRSATSQIFTFFVDDLIKR